ncbi:MAG TPA: hypothetical protein VNW97_22830 [Candidatus Saccharimonadales bacterium]|nr:hypothetical protein [Candidatus Saccharimonadales bacterium]
MGCLKAILAVMFIAGLSTNPAAQQTPVPAASRPAESSAATALPSASDAQEIVRRSVEIDHHNFERARNYTARQREVEKRLDKHGQVKSTDIKTYDITFLSGELYSRLIEKDDRPLEAKEQRKEEEKIEKFIAKHRDEGPQEREKRLAKQEKERQERRLFLRDVVNAFDFRLAGEEQIEGRSVYVIDAMPRQDFHPTQPHADLLSKVRGRLWIEKEDYNWVKAEVETIGTISFGLFLARIHQGSRLVFEQTRVNGEVWLVRRFALNASARLALVKNESIEQEDIFSNYRKFSAGTRILGIQELESH